MATALSSSACCNSNLNSKRPPFPSFSCSSSAYAFTRFNRNDNNVRRRSNSKLLLAVTNSCANQQPTIRNKKALSLPDPVYQYLLAHIREPEILTELREETSAMPGSQMQVSPDQAQMLCMLVQILGAECCIEVGVYTGYSSLAIAMALPASGRLVACDRDAKYLEVAKRYYERAGVQHKVDVRHGLALHILKEMLHKGEANRIYL
eukprot:TRINITY_DN20872_c0_g1_i2.p1 TRINITY_DN20872_c0_g1~~TRINITY_DN20872_c0_g1_i2.p1  ORF type:complete len:236 (+),score=22.16 TRINITY_DN20872_c0_g1_i2:92-709(+)